MGMEECVILLYPQESGNFGLGLPFKTKIMLCIVKSRTLEQINLENSSAGCNLLLCLALFSAVLCRALNLVMAESACHSLTVQAMQYIEHSKSISDKSPTYAL
jgi:hypothetical protein